MRLGTDGLIDDLREHRSFALGTIPAYARLLDLLLDPVLDDAAFGVVDCLNDVWRQRAFSASYERPLLIVASLRFAALRTGSAHPLYAALVEPGDAAGLSSEHLARAFREPVVLQALRERHVQTNEISRAVAWLWAAEAMASVCPGATLSLFDVGASAGLNLVADRLPRSWSDEEGRPLLRGGLLPPIALRRGYDRAPVDANDESACAWLRACVWVGQRERERRLSEALAAWRALRASPHAPQLLCRNIDQVPGELVFDTSHAVAYQTVVRDYLAAAERTSYESGMRAWLSRHPGRALWVELELAGDGSAPERSMALVAHAHSPEGLLEFPLARCHPHPDRLCVDRNAEAALLDWLRKGAA